MRAFLLCLLVLASSAVFAQSAEPVAKLKMPKGPFYAGKTIKATLIVTFAEGLHAYQNPPTSEFQIPLKISAVKGTTIGKVFYPKGIPMTMGGDPTPAMVYEGTIEIPVEIKLSKIAGKFVAKLSVDYQQCNESTCFPPSSVAVSAPIVVVAPIKK
ncbi:hypothetical protein BH11ARM1_BH11ARM1_07760 [soil metagenome]